MTALTLTTTREVTPAEVDDLIELLDFSRSPWFKSTEHADEIHGPTPWIITYDVPSSVLRTLTAGSGSAETTTAAISSQDILGAVRLAQPLLCCSHVITSGEELGHLCANDADIILQTAIFGRIVFG